MDREAREHYSVVIQAKDMAGQVGGLSGSTTINITLTDPLNYEKKKQYSLHISAENTHLDPRFSYLGSFKDEATLRVTVGDVDEPPLFSMDYYIMEVFENARVGTEVGAVTARDPDSKNSPV
ncbi:hypothetical protein DNTS_025521, partial [Danionella cerebrum]